MMLSGFSCAYWHLYTFFGKACVQIYPFFLGCLSSYCCTARVKKKVAWVQVVFFFFKSDICSVKLFCGIVVCP